MIIVQIIGGLGNQMFQYAAARSLSFEHQTKLKLDTREFAYHGFRKYSLNHFNIQEEFASKREIENLLGYYKCKAAKLMKFLRLDASAQIIHFNNIVEEKNLFFDKDFLFNPDDTYLKGYWQSEKYFSDIKDIIRQEFSFKAAQAKTNAEISESIRNTESVSIHFRRADYVNNPITNEYHGLCDISYYKTAIELILEKVSNPCFFVFSDEPEWVKENFSINFPTTIVTHNGSLHAHEDLRLMTQCKHNIIANSSFSWWGAWLNQNPDKIVTAPAKWYQAKVEFNMDDVVPQEWIVI